MKSWSLFPRITTVIATHALAVAQGAPIYKFQPVEVELVGVLKRHEFAGPPNYESVKRGDALEVYWLLHLPKPISVDRATPGDHENDPKNGVLALQVLILDYKPLKKLLGKRVRIVGGLFSARTGHHHTEVLIEPKSIVLAP